jgi:hypothetical protein
VLTNNPDKLASLAMAGVAIAGTVAPTRRRRSISTISPPSGTPVVLNGGEVRRAAVLPEPVSYFRPYALPDALHLIHVASTWCRS